MELARHFDIFSIHSFLIMKFYDYGDYGEKKNLIRFMS